MHEYITTRDMMHTGIEQHTFEQCHDCKLVMLTPRVPLHELSDYYQSHYLPYRGAAAWGKYAYLVERDQRSIDKQRTATVSRYGTLTGDSVVLDIGCGKPTFLAALQSRTSAQCYGTDFSSHGWQHDENNYPTLHLHEGLPTEVELPSPADVITMWHYLEHDYEPLSTLQDLHRHATSTTKLIIEVPDHDGSTRKQYGSHWAGYHTPRHTGLYTVGSLTTLLNRSGWQVHTSYRYGTLDPYTLAWMSRMEQQGIDWSASMESRFWPYVLGMLAYAPKKLRKEGHGFMTIVATPA